MPDGGRANGAGTNGAGARARAAQYDDTYKPRDMTPREQEILMDSMQEFSQMQAYRATFAAMWQEIAELIWPNAKNTFYFGSYNFPGQKKTERQVDASGMVALKRFGAICDSIMTPKNMQYQALQADDPYVMKDRATQLWFETATNTLFRHRYAAMSGFVGQNQNNFLNLGAFGNLGMLIDELDIGSYPWAPGLRYKSMNMGEMFFRENHQGIVDGFIRWFKMSAQQAWEKFGVLGTFPEELRAPLKAKSPMLYDFIQRVVPRDDFDPDRIDARGKPYMSVYISMTGKRVCSEGGYRMMPAAISRYEQAPGEVYGRGPAGDVLPSLKTLNAQKATFLKQGHRIADPVLLTADDGIVDVSLRPGALNKGGVSGDGKPLIHVLPTGNIQTNEKMMDMEKGLIDDVFLVSLFRLALQDHPQMTATQVIEMVNQKSILIAPTMGRQEGEYLSVMVERELDILSNQGLLPPQPPRLREAKGAFKVVSTSPLAKMARSQQASGFMRSIEISKEIVNITQDASYLDWADFDAAMPDIADIQGVPASYMADDASIAKKRKLRANAQARQEQIQAAPAQAALMKAQAAQSKAGIGQGQVPPGQQPAQPGPPLAQQMQQ